jgi:DNA-binding PadR family transcriptional regulator
MTSAPDPESYLPLSPHAFQILLALLEEVRHPYSILRDIQERTRGEMVLGTSTAYSAIKRMVADGLLREVTEVPPEPSGGPRRRYYGLTQMGRDVARAEGLRIARLHRMVEESALWPDKDGSAPQEAGS